MIHSLTVRNFKSIKNLECTFPQFAAIVGMNAAGKTNILQSIAVLKELVAGDPVDPVLGKIILVPAEIFNKDTTDKVSVIGIELHDDESRFYLEVSIRLINGNVPANFVIGHEKLEIIGDDKRVLVYERKENHQIEDGNGNTMPISADPKKLFVALFNSPEASTVRQIFQKIQIPDPQLMDSRDTIVGASEKNLAGLLIELKHNSPQIYTEFEKVAKKLLPNFSSISETAATRTEPTNSPPSEEHYLILFEEKHLRGQLSVKLLSAGDVRTLYIMAVVIGMAPKGTLILEEIENGIHQKRIEEIMEHLRHLSHVKEIQIIFTTHSERVINRLAPQEVLYVEKDLAKGTSLKALSEVGELSYIQEVLNKGGKLSDLLSVNLGK